MNWLSKSLSISLGTLVIWGFLMALLFNVFMHFTKSKSDKLLLFSSFAMFFSYFISDHFWDLYNTSSVYLVWLGYDLVTLILIYAVSNRLKLLASPGVFYVYIGLAINSLLFLIMHIDTKILENDDYWWLWGDYSAGVNIIDFIMIIGLIINKDYLGLIRLYKFITSPIRKKALS
jgi:hypothetical protein